MLRLKYDEAEITVIKKVLHHVVGINNNVGHFEAFWTLEQKVVFYYKKWSKTLLDFGTHLPHALALLGAFRNTLELLPNKFLSHFDLRITRKQQKLPRGHLRNLLDLSSLISYKVVSLCFFSFLLGISFNLSNTSNSQVYRFPDSFVSTVSFFVDKFSKF